MAKLEAARGATMLVARTREAVAAGDPPSERPAIVMLIKDALSETVDLVQAHVELAVLELREDARVGVRVALVLGVGSALALLALAFGLAAAAFGLAVFLPAWLACLVVAVVIGSLAAVTLARGRRRLRKHEFSEQTALALQESDH